MIICFRDLIKPIIMIQITAIELKIKDHLVGLFNVIEHIVLG